METIVNAVMLRAVDYNENDKILTLLTAEYGKISAGIKGVKKAGAKLRFACQPFCFAEYVLSRRGDKYTVINASECESFYDIRTDIDKFYRASIAVEAADALTYSDDGDGGIFPLLVGVLAKLSAEEGNGSLISYLLSVLKCSGYGINSDNCPVCGKPLTEAGSLRFDMDSGSFICGGCGDGAQASRTTFNVIRKASDKPFDFTFISADGEKRALRLIREYVLYKLNITIKSLSDYIRLL